MCGNLWYNVGMRDKIIQMVQIESTDFLFLTESGRVFKKQVAPPGILANKEITEFTDDLYPEEEENEKVEYKLSNKESNSQNPAR